MNARRDARCLVLLFASGLLLAALPAGAQNYQLKWEDISAGGETGTSPGFKTAVNLGETTSGTGTSPSFQAEYAFAPTTRDLVPTGVGVKPPSFAQSLGQNYPNPFNPSTTIPFSLARDTRVALRVYNVRGQLVRTLLDEPMKAGADYSVVWDGHDDRGTPVASGVYFYHMVTDRWAKTNKMVLLK
jgi:hypothetical protein